MKTQYKNNITHLAVAIIASLIIALTTIAIWQTSTTPTYLAIYTTSPDRIMGTTCTLTIIAFDDQSNLADSTLQQAEAALRKVEALMSVYINESEISKLNAAPADQPIRLSTWTIEVLHAALSAFGQTNLAFDITARPLFQLWKQCAKADRLPTDDERSIARAQSNWNAFILTTNNNNSTNTNTTTANFATKSTATARVDLGGIAKGFAIDRAIEIMQANHHIKAGIVDVGGDIRCFSLPSPTLSYSSALSDICPIKIRNPFDQSILLSLRVDSTAICTSGNYARYVEIDGKRFSHIIDPRTGTPADTIPSVTVIAPDAITADTWATSLSILGTRGFSLLPTNTHAMIITGTPDNHQLYATPGFINYLSPYDAHLKNKIIIVE